MNATQTTYAAQHEIAVGDIVVVGSSGDTDCDIGEILEIAADGDTAMIAWELGACRTSVQLSDADVTVWATYHRSEALVELAHRRAGVESHR